MDPVWPASPSSAPQPEQSPAPPHRPSPANSPVRGMDVIIVPLAALGVTGLAGLLWSKGGLGTVTARLTAAEGSAMHAVAATLYLTAIAAVVILFLLRGARFADAGWRGIRARWLVLTLGLWALYIAVFGGLNLWLNPEGIDMVDSQNRQMLGQANLWLAIAVLAFLAPVAEEIYFRGVLFAWLRHKTGALTAAALTSLFFAAIHTNYLMADPVATLLALLQIGTLGFIAALLYEKSGSLLPAILFHMTNNLVVTLATAAAV